MGVTFAELVSSVEAPLLMLVVEDRSPASISVFVAEGTGGTCKNVAISELGLIKNKLCEL